MIQDRRFALIFRVAAFGIAITGLLAMMGALKGEIHFGALAFYTMQSNILAIILFGMLVVRTAIGLREGNKGSVGYYARFEMICTIDIMLTLLVFWILLAPTLFSMVGEFSMWSFDNLAVHLFTPLLCLVDYILFSPPRHLKYRDVYYVCIFPIVYLIGTSIAGLLGYVYMIASDGSPMRFPYFFYDFDRIGAVAFIYIGALILFFLIIGHVFYFIDKKRRCKNERASTRNS